MLVRNDPAYYDRLADAWWDPGGPLAMLQWISASRAEVLPPARPGELLVDIGCGGGLFSPHARRLGYRYLGADLSASALAVAAGHGARVVRADGGRLPLPDGCAAVVLAGEVLEHVHRPTDVVAEACRVLRDGGTLLVDTVARTRWARFAAVTVGERMPGGPPPGLHDPALFVDRAELVAAAAAHGVRLRLVGLRPGVLAYLGWLAGRRPTVPLHRTGSTRALFSAVGVKLADRSGSGS